MSKNYNPVIVHYSANTLLQSSANTKYVKVFGYVESNQDVAWFNSKQYKEDGLFGTKRSLDNHTPRPRHFGGGGFHLANIRENDTRI